MRGRALLILGLLMAAVPADAADPSTDGCEGEWILKEGGAFVLPRNATLLFSRGNDSTVVLANNSTDPPQIFLGSGSSPSRISYCAKPVLPVPDLRPLPREPLPPLVIVALASFWSGPGELTVVWLTNVPAMGRVAWGPGPGGYLGYADVQTWAENHSFVIRGLTDGADYRVHLLAISEASELMQAEIHTPLSAPAAVPGPNWVAATLSVVAACGAVAAFRGALKKRE